MNFKNDYENKYLTFQSECNDILMIYYPLAQQALLKNIEFACQAYIRQDYARKELEIEFFQKNNPCDKEELSKLIQSEIIEIQNQLINWASND